MNFGVAHSEKYRDAAGETKERTLWVDCAYWTDRTAVAPYLKKGTQVFVEGIPDVRTYNKNDGTPGVSLTLRVLNVQLLGSKPEVNNVKSNGMPVGELVEEGINDLPF
jgi:single-strand DNA-binding protein